MKWNDPIAALGIAKLTPEPGCLVLWGDKWKVLDGFDGIWHGKNSIRNDSTPILPRVPEGKTCWDVFASLLCGINNVSDFAGVAFTILDLHRVVYDRTKCFKDDGSPVGLEMEPINRSNTIERRNLPYLLGDTQKYMALLEWIAANA
ncbi:hypothetical protein LCGC14_1320290 [marine sediment metagenome]|uniref:Uncharacterized protein n=1 Tax=marine sediment metagenome TaxID=412755 RepID=A0A0F9KKA3_9ZZZZ